MGDWETRGMLEEENEQLEAEVARLRAFIAESKREHPEKRCWSLSVFGKACGCGAEAYNAKVDEIISKTVE